MTLRKAFWLTVAPMHTVCINKGGESFYDGLHLIPPPRKEGMNTQGYMNTEI